MGWETGNVHLGTKESINAISRHLKKMKANWLYAAAKEMAEMVTKDWRAWSKQISN
jgi:hypothetical protein